MPIYGPMTVRYRFNAAKALQAIEYVVADAREVDLHTVLKSFYFGDKSHLNAFQQPIFGATYKAMKYGPVPLEVYEMVKSENLWLSELGLSAMPWRLQGFKLERTQNSDPSLDMLGDSEREHFLKAYEKSRYMNFTERTAATHGPDWQAANLGTMRYEDMIDPGPDRLDVISFMQETARHTRL